MGNSATSPAAEAEASEQLEWELLQPAEPEASELERELLQAAEYENDMQEIMKAVKEAVDRKYKDKDDESRGEIMLHLTEYLEFFANQTMKTSEKPFTLSVPHSIIKRCLNDENALNAYVIKLYEKSIQPENQARFEKWYNDTTLKMSLEIDVPTDPYLHQRETFDAADATKNAIVEVVGRSTSFLVKQGLSMSKNLFSVQATTALDEVLTLGLGDGLSNLGTTVGTSLGAIGLVALYNLWCYYKGTRTLTRVKKNLIDSTAAIAAGNAAGLVVNFLLTFIFGPIGLGIGLLVQGVMGVAVGGITHHYVSKWTLKYFDLPKDEALEMAYEKLGLTKNATDEELRQQCRHLLRLNHPDYLARQENPPDEKGIQEAVEKFVEIQNAHKFIMNMRATELSDAACQSGTSAGMGDKFKEFVENLLSFRRKQWTQAKELGFYEFDEIGKEILEEEHLDEDASANTGRWTNFTNRMTTVKATWLEYFNSLRTQES